jgi:hypothetical protein
MTMDWAGNAAGNNAATFVWSHSFWCGFGSFVIPLRLLSRSHGIWRKEIVPLIPSTQPWRVRRHRAKIRPPGAARSPHGALCDLPPAPLFDEAEDRSPVHRILRPLCSKLGPGAAGSRGVIIVPGARFAGRCSDRL